MCLVPIEWKGLKVITEISWWIDPAVQLSYFYIFAFHGTHRFESSRKEKAAARWRYDLGIHYNLFHCNVLYVNSSLFEIGDLFLYFMSIIFLGQIVSQPLTIMIGAIFFHLLFDLDTQYHEQFFFTNNKIIGLIEHFLSK